MKTTRKLSTKNTFGVMSAVAGLALTLLFLLCAVTVQAQTLIDPLVNAVSSELLGYQRNAIHTVDGSGLTAGPSTILGAADSTADNGASGVEWTTVGGTDWGFGADQDPSITYDLAAFYNLQTIRIWNYNEGGFNFVGPQSILLSTSADGVNFTSNSIINLTQGPGTNGEAAQDFAVSIANIRYVKMEILTTWDGVIYTNSFTPVGSFSGTNDWRSVTGLSEVRFVGALLTTPHPVLTPSGGTYQHSVTLVISDSDPSATIYYSTDAWVTTNVYSGPIALPGSSVGGAGITVQSYANDPAFIPSQSTAISGTYYSVASPVWVNPNGGSWASTSTSWSNNIPANGVGVNADFSKLTLPGNAIVTLDGNWQVGSLTFGDVGNTHSWELDPGTGPNLWLDLEGTTTPNITVVNQSVTMNAALRGSHYGIALTKTGNGTLRLGLGTLNDYRAETLVSNGTFAVDGTLGDSSARATSDVRVEGGTLSGIGSILGSVTVHSGGTFMPGTSSLNDGLTISGYRLVLEGNTLMRIAVNANTPANNQVSLSGLHTSGFVSYGGVLTVTNITSDGSPLTAGNTFILFNGAPAHFGAFNSYHLPALPAGLSWDVSGLYVNGSISVTANTPAPLFNPPGETFVAPLTVAISCLDASAVIHYTTNAWATANVYNGTPINVPTNAGFVIQAYAKDPSLSGSSTNSASYTASPVITPVGVQDSSELLDYDRYAYHTIDGSGLTAGGSGILGAADSTVNIFSGGAMWLTTGHNWSTPDDANPYLIYDLGLVYNLQTTRIWNYNEGGGDYQKFGAASILLSTSADGVSFTTFGIINPAKAGATSTEPAQDFATAVTGVRYVKMQVLTNWDGGIFWSSITGHPWFSGNTDSRGLAGLSEVRFVGTPAPAITAQPVIVSTTVSGGNLIFSGTGGTANASYSVLTTTDLTTPRASWTLLSTGNFDGSGAFSVTTPISSGSGQKFYTIRTP